MGSQNILIKPHHFIDIIKLYGAGLNHFTPDERFGHDFYRIGNMILSDKDVKLSFTIDSDDICKPCKCLIDNKCSDFMSNGFLYKSKEEWNKIIDKRLINYLDIQEDINLSSEEFCEIIQLKLTDNIIKRIWSERPKEETVKRIKFLKKGVLKYLNKK